MLGCFLTEEEHFYRAYFTGFTGTGLHKYSVSANDLHGGKGVLDDSLFLPF